MSVREVKPLSDRGVFLRGELLARAAKYTSFTSFWRQELVPVGIGKKTDPSIVSRLFHVSPEFPRGKYEGDTPKMEERMEMALRRLEAKERSTAPVPVNADEILELPRFRALYNCIEANARETRKRRGVLYIGGTGAAKTIVCHHVAAKYTGSPLFDRVVSLVCSSAWRSEKSFFEDLASALACTGGPWRDLRSVQGAVTQRIIEMGRVLFVIDEFQCKTDAPLRGLIWLENKTLARWLCCGDLELWRRLCQDSKRIPNVKQFLWRNRQPHIVDQLYPDDARPFVDRAEAKGARIAGDREAVVARVAAAGTSFGLFNFIADWLPRYLEVEHGNVWSVATVDAAVLAARKDYGMDDETIRKGRGTGFVAGRN